MKNYEEKSADKARESRWGRTNVGTSYQEEEQEETRRLMPPPFPLLKPSQKERGVKLQCVLL
jgi:hypothetical protein